MRRRIAVLSAEIVPSLAVALSACGAPLPVPPPSFGSDTHAAVAPPPISGGTLLVLHEGGTAVAADPDRDRIYGIDLANRTLRWDVTLAPGDQPWRAAEDGAGRVHVVLRGTGDVVSLDPNVGQVLVRTHVCNEVRGVAYDPHADALHVACAGGELVTLDAASQRVLRSVDLDVDLRDVVMEGDRLRVSRFRFAELLDVNADGTVAARRAPAPVTETRRTVLGRAASDTPVQFAPDLAWRTVALPSGGVAMVHQRAQIDPINLAMGYWNIACNTCTCSIVESTITFFEQGVPVTSPILTTAVLPVDLAVSRDGARIAVVAAGNATMSGYDQLIVYSTEALRTSDPCILPDSNVRQPAGQATAVAFDGTGVPIVQTREPAALVFGDDGTTVSLSAISRADTGETVFHSNSGRFVACASCHAEGAEDGHVWNFSDTGPRRTQSLRGGLLATAPFHWDGHLADMGALVHETFEQRMGGPALSDAQIDALAHWIDAQPAYRASVRDPAAVERGRAIFGDPAVGCTGCHRNGHGGIPFDESVGTGGMFQVPSLAGVAFRPPYLHDGCAPTLLARFGPCGGRDRHGHTSQLTDAQRADLVAFVASL